jgi:hypothetical protein
MAFDPDKFWRTCDACGKVVKNKEDMDHFGDEHNIFISQCKPCSGYEEEIEYEEL